MRQPVVDRRVDAIAGALDVAGAALHLAVVDADLHEGRAAFTSDQCRPNGNLIVAVGLARHRQRQVD